MNSLFTTLFLYHYTKQLQTLIMPDIRLKNNNTTLLIGKDGGRILLRVTSSSSGLIKIKSNRYITPAGLRKILRPSANKVVRGKETYNVTKSQMNSLLRMAGSTSRKSTPVKKRRITTKRKRTLSPKRRRKTTSRRRSRR